MKKNLEKMSRVRIVKREFGGRITYEIQQKHFLFKWMWVDAWVNSMDGTAWSTFYTLQEARDNLYLFDGTKPKETVIKV